MIRQLVEWLAKRKGLACVLAGAAVLCLGAGAYAAWLLTPPALPRTLPEAVRLAQSARYQRLDAGTRAQYLERMQQLFRDSPREDRRALWEQMRDDPEAREALRRMTDEMMGLRLQEFAKADAKQRERLLDEMIDQQPRGPRPATRPSGEGRRPGGAAGGDRMARMKQSMQNGNPQRQALMREFMRAMRERRQQRGLPAGPGGPGGGRG